LADLNLLLAENKKIQQELVQVFSIFSFVFLAILFFFFASEVAPPQRCQKKTHVRVRQARKPACHLTENKINFQE